MSKRKKKPLNDPDRHSTTPGGLVRPTPPLEQHERGLTKQQVPATSPATQEHSPRDQSQQRTPELWQFIRDRIYQRFGLKGLMVVGILGLVILVWSNWDKAQTFPGVKQIATWISRPSIPKADPSRYAVVVALFENDEDRQQQRLVISALSEFKGIQVLTLERKISLHGADADAAERMGHQAAKEYLQGSGAEALRWGKY